MDILPRLQMIHRSPILVSCDSSDIEWRKYPGLNCYPGHRGSAVWIENDKKCRSRAKMSLDEAQRYCQHIGAVAFTYDKDAGIVWPLKEVHPDMGKHGTKYDL